MKWLAFGGLSVKGLAFSSLGSLAFSTADRLLSFRSKIQGLGLYAARDLEKGQMIIEYIGEVIRYGIYLRALTSM
jgi:SET domain-containing protein